MFSFSGRIRRMTLWVNGLVNLVFYLIVFAIGSASDSVGVVLVLVLVYLVLVIRGLSLSVRRWHDLNKSGAWVLIVLVPIVGALYALVMQGFVAGDQGANSYGPPPEPGQLI